MASSLSVNLLWCQECTHLEFTVSLEREGTLFYLHIKLHNHQNDLNPSICDYIIMAKSLLDWNNKNNKKETTEKTNCS